MITPSIETERLMLRPMSIADAEAAYYAWTSDPDVARFMNWAPHTSIDETIEWMKHEEENYSSATIYSWGFVLKETGELIGSGGVKWKDDLKMFELFYSIAKKYWNKGLTTEAAQAFISVAYQKLGIKQILARYAKENSASGRVIEKLGFVYKKDSVYTNNKSIMGFEVREYLLTLDT